MPARVCPARSLRKSAILPGHFNKIQHFDQPRSDCSSFGFIPPIISPPFGKGRVGGISGQAFSKRQSDSHFHNSPRMTEEQKLKDIFFRRARRVHREDLKKNDLPWSNILVFFLPCEPCSRGEREKSFCFSPSRMPRLRKWSEVLVRQDRNGR